MTREIAVQLTQACTLVSWSFFSHRDFHSLWYTLQWWVRSNWNKFKFRSSTTYSYGENYETKQACVPNTTPCLCV